MDFPFADPPEIIRANQKDEDVQADLIRRITSVLQSLKGVRYIHKHTLTIQAIGTLLYLGLTTLAGSRTVGEEYTDIFYLTGRRKLPSKLKLALYVLTSGLSPLIIPRVLAKIRPRLHRLLSTEEEDEDEPSFIEEMLTPTTLVSVNLAIFYLSGAYYQIAKRIFGLRYAVGHRVDPLTRASGSYEIISVLMIARAVFKLVVALRDRISQGEKSEEIASAAVDVTELGPSLEDEKVLPFIRNESRRCNLCLEPMTAPTVTLCGHLYCWSCVSGWCRQHSECPLCRQECHEQHLLQLRV